MGANVKHAYLLAAFYSSAAKHKGRLAEINASVRQVSSGDMQVLLHGTGGLVIGFTSDQDHAQLSGKFSRLGEEKFHYALIQGAATICGYMDSKSLEWLSMRLPRPKKAG